MSVKGFGLIVAMALLAAGSPGRAETLRVLAGGAVTAPAREIAADFTRKTGVIVDVVSGTSGVLVQKVRAGEAADLALLTGATMDTLQKEGLIVPASRTDLARALMGICVRAGAPVPDLSTVEAFKAALLAARSVSYVNPAAGGTSGAYFEGLMQRLGLGEAIKAKTVYRTEGSLVAQAVANGEAELGVSFTSELTPNPGVKVAGYLPDAVQMPTIYTVAIVASSTQAKTARAFLDALHSPAGTAVFTRAGLPPLAAR
jgi:molybdate transport system substrate-binding protein